MDIFCLQETWLPASEDVSSFFPNHNLIHSPATRKIAVTRQGRFMGGILIGLKKSLNMSFKIHSQTAHWIILQISIDIKTFLGVVFLPSNLNANILKNFSTSYGKLSNNCPKIHVLDFNGGTYKINSKLNASTSNPNIEITKSSICKV